MFVNTTEFGANTILFAEQIDGNSLKFWLRSAWTIAENESDDYGMVDATKR